ncbi:MAG: hypothetical protein GY858_02145 [Candidatus Omnitrophica bacterium]|nr:hypothetical protein [Candidatus Omnitrophota bacterium]
MDKQKKQMIIVGALVLVLIVVVINNLAPKKKKKKSRSAVATSTGGINLPPAVKSKTATSSQSTFVRASPDEIRKQHERAGLEWGMDPFYHKINKDVYHGSSLTLKGVSIDQKGRGYAIINNEIVTVGNFVFGYKVDEVEKNKVLLKRGAESFYLVLPQDE